jgi:hypothetical protein
MSEKDVHAARLHQAGVVVDAHFGDGEVAGRHDQTRLTVEQCELWNDVLKGRLELAALNTAADELNNGFYNIATGQYREAYGNLRLWLELSMATVRFSVDEFALRQWLRDRSDIIWSELVKERDQDKPIFTTEFVSAFNEDMGGRWTQYRTIANKLHRELSTHVHGAASTRRASRALTFVRENALGWLQNCEDGHLAWQYLMLARYSEILKSQSTELTPAFKAMLSSKFAGVSEASGILEKLGAT